MTLRLASAVALLATTSAFAGDLNPPAGPVAPTPGPEPRIPINATNTPGDADSVHRIATSGSYYLTGNLTGVAAKHGIEIAATDVTIDLMGFQMVGVASALDGIASPTGNARVTVRNGVIRGWVLGVDVAASSRVLVSDVMVDTCSGGGISAGAFAMVSRCRVGSCGGVGIALNNYSHASDCVAELGTGNGFGFTSGTIGERLGAHLNTGMGIRATGSVTLRGCAARSNTSNGIAVGQGSVLEACDARFSGGFGFDVSAGCSALNCVAESNTGAGFNFEGQGRLEACVAANHLAAAGFVVATGGVVSSCHSGENETGFAFVGSGVARGSTASVCDTVGFDMAAGSVLDSCTATGCVTGFDLEDDSVATGCTAIDNSSYGFAVPGDRVHLSRCTATLNGTTAGVEQHSGIRVTGIECTVRECVATGNIVGIIVLSMGSTVVQNISHGNSGVEYSVTIGVNAVGTIVATPVGSGANDNIGY